MELTRKVRAVRSDGQDEKTKRMMAELGITQGQRQPRQADGSGSEDDDEWRHLSAMSKQLRQAQYRKDMGGKPAAAQPAAAAAELPEEAPSGNDMSAARRRRAAMYAQEAAAMRAAADKVDGAGVQPMPRSAARLQPSPEPRTVRSEGPQRPSFNGRDSSGSSRDEEEAYDAPRDGLMSRLLPNLDPVKRSAAQQAEADREQEELLANEALMEEMTRKIRQAAAARPEKNSKSGVSWGQLYGNYEDENYNPYQAPPEESSGRGGPAQEVRQGNGRGGGGRAAYSGSGSGMASTVQRSASSMAVEEMAGSSSSPSAAAEPAAPRYAGQGAQGQQPGADDDAAAAAQRRSLRRRHMYRRHTSSKRGFGRSKGE